MPQPHASGVGAGYRKAVCDEPTVWVETEKDDDVVILWDRKMKFKGSRTWNFKESLFPIAYPVSHSPHIWFKPLSCLPLRFHKTLPLFTLNQNFGMNPAVLFKQAKIKLIGKHEL